MRPYSPCLMVSSPPLGRNHVGCHAVATNSIASRPSCPCPALTEHLYPWDRAPLASQGSIGVLPLSSVQPPRGRRRRSVGRGGGGEEDQRKDALCLRRSIAEKEPKTGARGKDREAGTTTNRDGPRTLPPPRPSCTPLPYRESSPSWRRIHRGPNVSKPLSFLLLSPMFSLACEHAFESLNPRAHHRRAPTRLAGPRSTLLVAVFPVAL
jgi:hypothetical protein